MTERDKVQAVVLEGIEAAYQAGYVSGYNAAQQEIIAIIEREQLQRSNQKPN